jgi:nitrite reductase (NADH) small subunit
MAAWQAICRVNDLQPDSGVCALIAGQQVAIFYMPKDNKIYAIQNYDPIGKANVLSRGMIGDIKGEPVVASPLYKQHFNLLTGQCLEDDSICLVVYDIRINNDNVEILLPEPITKPTGQYTSPAELSS